MTNAFKILSLLLSYPTEDLQAAAEEVKAAIAADTLLGKREKALLSGLAEDIAGRDIYDAEERYVHLFDRTRTLSLHLFEHVHGESRERGQAMVDLLAMYEEQGFAIGAKELPDYIPLFLEYLSTRPKDEARELLGQTQHIVAAIKSRLKKRKSIYAGAFVALEALAKGKRDDKLVKELLDTPDHDPDDLGELDRIWEEEAVTFGGNAGDAACGPDRLRTRIRAANREVRDTPAQSN